MADDSSNGIVWFLAGLGVGAALGILYAPKSGRETRESLLNAADESREAVRERTRQYREQAEKWYEKGRDAVSQQKEQFNSAFEAGKRAYREATEPEGSPKV
jgi:gas vesicle protein